tara:strand:- start:662 stop:862 length:201 start_codon:yes stop_codon:yes gene_type:complete
MGFNKRYLNKDFIIGLSERDLKMALRADTLITTDKWSSKFLDLYSSGKTKNEIIKLLEDEKRTDRF